MISNGKGWGKLLLFGEHSAVHGYPAVGMALEQNIHIELHSCPSQITGPDTFMMNQLEVHGLLARHHRIFEQLWQHVLHVLPACRNLDIRQIRIHSSIPYEMGFGSSGALAVAIVQACEQASKNKNAEYDGQQYWKYANDIERIFHGTPSGIDTGLALFGGCQAFFPSPLTSAGERTLPRRKPLAKPGIPLLFGSVPRQSSTKELVASVHTQVQKNPEPTKKALARLGDIASSAIEILESPVASIENRALSLGELAREAQTQLASLSLSNETLEMVFSILKEHGSCGEKISGAGGGGAFYAIFPDIQNMRNAAVAIKDRLSQTGQEFYLFESPA